MPTGVRRRIGDGLAVACGLVILVLTIVAADSGVRERAAILLGAGRPLMGLPDASARLGDLARSVVQVTGAFGHAHSFWTMSAVAAVLLLAAVSRL
jgi:hypothetical protein